MLDTARISVSNFKGHTLNLLLYWYLVKANFICVSFISWINKIYQFINPINTNKSIKAGDFLSAALQRSPWQKHI